MCCKLGAVSSMHPLPSQPKDSPWLWFLPKRGRSFLAPTRNTNIIKVVGLQTQKPAEVVVMQ